MRTKTINNLDLKAFTRGYITKLLREQVKYLQGIDSHPVLASNDKAEVIDLLMKEADKYETREYSL